MRFHEFETEAVAKCRWNSLERLGFYPKSIYQTSEGKYAFWSY
jgi:hypothetical protein